VKRVPTRVSFTDKDGYTVTITRLRADDPRRAGIFHCRQGLISITSPAGKTKNCSYWMDHPEKGWMYRGIDLFTNFFVDAKKREDVVWYRIPVKTRMQIEARHQATAYKPLREQFKDRKNDQRAWSRRQAADRAILCVLEGRGT
jgi:hypothetical protein